MRDKSFFEIVCSGCGNPVDFDKPGDQLRKEPCSAIEYNGAGQITIKLAVRPCRVCVESAKRPMELIREALNLPKV